jgi:NTP pyrophosphatase (non-canonical NTP hydrolase)
VDLKYFSRKNLERCISPDNGFNHPIESWGPEQWTNAVAGEVGEACNVAKKLLRLKQGIRGNTELETTGGEEWLKRKLASELADVICYCDLTMQAIGFDTSTVLFETFNNKSKQLGSSIVLDSGIWNYNPDQFIKLLSEFVVCVPPADICKYFVNHPDMMEVALLLVARCLTHFGNETQFILECGELDTLTLLIRKDTYPDDFYDQIDHIFRENKQFLFGRSGFITITSDFNVPNRWL